ncbi:hypothetical protein [Actinomadura yumaensis]|uniref:Uncharacterized protein n=1 Tax=Actinomadura yumaensis TaxID=111807 RepID=A0ABW2CS50_9ACTN
MTTRTAAPRPLATVPPNVVAVLDAINARLGWPRDLRTPCPGHMTRQHKPIDGITVTAHGDHPHRHVEVRVADVLVGTGACWTGSGNAGVRCLLPHGNGLTDPWSVALHQGGALNEFQLHILTEHSTHGDHCHNFRRSDHCHLCQAHHQRRCPGCRNHGT